MEGTPEQQIQKLQAEYQAKLDQIKAQTPEAEYPQAEADQILQEHQAVSHAAENMIQEEVPGFQASSHEPQHTVFDLPEDKQAQVQQWVAMASSDPSKAVKAARDSNDIALIDAFHGALTGDKNFAEMVKRGALEQLAA